MSTLSRRLGVASVTIVRLRLRGRRNIHFSYASGLLLVLWNDRDCVSLLDSRHGLDVSNAVASWYDFIG
jgi:hypothetical protein